jgi:hypothetical protein
MLCPGAVCVCVLCAVQRETERACSGIRDMSASSCRGSMSSTFCSLINTLC